MVEQFMKGELGFSVTQTIFETWLDLARSPLMASSCPLRLPPIHLLHLAAHPQHQQGALGCMATHMERAERATATSCTTAKATEG